MDKYTIAGRGSWLSLAQIALFKSMVLEKIPGARFETVVKKTAGDIEQSIPLHLVEGKDFFTREIQESLATGEADFAVHSMKDVSSESFFNESHYTIIDRNDLRDVAIFNPCILEKLTLGSEIIIGTSSPRRSQMAVDFLVKALPQLNTNGPNIKAQPIRGNVDARLAKLHEGQYDGIILAAAGLNRLLEYQPSASAISHLLQHKKLMLLPLFECPPAAGQGAIVVETRKDNHRAIKVLEQIRHDSLTNAIQRERIYAAKYGYGCSQSFGVFHPLIEGIDFTYASGKNQQGEFTEWSLDISLDPRNKEVFSASDFMRDFFSYRFISEAKAGTETKAVFVASHKAIHSQKLVQSIKQKRVFAAGTKTWFSLARKGIWIEGCADGLGLEYFARSSTNPLINLSQKDLEIITNTESAVSWIKDGWKAIGTYELIPLITGRLKEAVSKADIVYWTSFRQYESCKTFLKPGIQHACPSGRTVTLFHNEGIYPVVFPGIKSFNQWKQKHSTATTEG